LDKILSKDGIEPSRRSWSEKSAFGLRTTVLRKKVGYEKQKEFARACGLDDSVLTHIMRDDPDRLSFSCLAIILKVLINNTPNKLSAFSNTNQVAEWLKLISFPLNQKKVDAILALAADEIKEYSKATSLESKSHKDEAVSRIQAYVDEIFHRLELIQAELDSLRRE